MTVMPVFVEGSSGESANVVQVLADWWTRPDATRIALWGTAEYRMEVSAIWQNVFGASPDRVEAMLSNAVREQGQLAAEYERLFVGPSSVPCPPYEAVWRTDRPKYEQGTVMGKSTLQVKQIYKELGIQLRPDQPELADHIAIELEALALSLAIGDQQHAGQLLQALREWLPQFCLSVNDQSLLEFYRNLAGITREAVLSNVFGS